MKKLMFCLVASGFFFSVSAQVIPDSWALTDKLGRRSPEYGDVRQNEGDKTVAMFYWTWHTDALVEYDRIGNVTEILRQYPEALYDIKHPAWVTGGNQYFWDEPLWGYYRTTDPWVLRKHAEMLADAGVDVVFFDCTNASLVWKSSYDVLLKVWSKALKDGVNAPKIGFLLPFGAVEWAYESLKFLYEDIYKANRYPELWFYWDDKPLIMAYDEMIPDETGTINEELRNFFTFRPAQGDLVQGPTNNKMWGWLENYPQHGFVSKPNGGFEQVTVGIAQNANKAQNGRCYAFNAPETFSRSYTYKNGHINMPQSYYYGFNFMEQWERAFELDPDLVFVTGWNEFIAGKYDDWPPWDPYKPIGFPDQFDWERSRDIEPVKSWGQLADIYYCQLISQVRRFKGIHKPQEYRQPEGISASNIDLWNEVYPVYEHYRGNVFHRDHPGHADTYYINNTGRNDLVRAKVAEDVENLYFYIETDFDITTPTDNGHWMTLFIDIDRDKSTGWEGYDYIVNRITPAQGKSVLEKSTRDWNWQRKGELNFEMVKNKLIVTIPKKLLGLEEGISPSLEFKWNDNMQDPGNLIDFYVNGDTAPGGRFNFVYNPK